MLETVEIRPMRWCDTAEVFDNQSPLLIFVVDPLEPAWATVPEDLRDMLQTLQVTGTSVRLFQVDVRAEAGFLDLFGIRPRPAVVRRLPDEATFEILRATRGSDRAFSWFDLIEFCRSAYAWKPRFSAFGASRCSASSAAGELTLHSA